MFLGAFIGVIVLLVVYVLSMLLYFVLRKKFIAKKYLLEIVIVFVSLFLSIGVKFIILCSSSSIKPFDSGFVSILHALYSGIGGLTFGGLNPLDEVSSSILQYLYTGTSLYAALMFVSVVTSKVSYEIYSYIMLKIMRVKMRYKQVDLFVFSSVNEESLILSESITKRYKENKKELLIVYSGEGLQPLDRKNILHRRIMVNGYLYWSYTKDYRNVKSFLNQLKLKIDNDYLSVLREKENEVIYRDPRHKDCKIHYFALETNEDNNGLESKNSDIVFEEIESYLAEVFDKKCRKLCIIDYYILTGNEINYQYYDRRLEDIVKKYELFGRSDELKKYFQLHIINEAVISGKSLSKQRYNVLDDDAILCDSKPNNANVYRTMVLGFGKNGQEAMKNVYIDTSFVNESGEPSIFIVDAYDTQIEEKSGVFASSHPLFICKNCEEVKELSLDEVSDNYERIKEIYKKKINKNNSFDDINKYMSFPIIGFHKTSCFDISFLNYLDKRTGIDPIISKKSIFNSFIIAFGNDELNIMMANVLLSDIKHETIDNKARLVEPQIVYVNIRHQENMSRIDWTEEDKQHFPNLKVIRFGDIKNIYSYDQIIDESLSINYNYSYNYIAGDQDATSLFNNALDKLESNTLESIDFNGIIKDYKEVIDKKDKYTCSRLWLSTSSFDKESNDNANRFGEYFRIRFDLLRKKSMSITKKELLNLSMIEHERWNRVHISHGWVYADYDKGDKVYRKSIKEHNCLYKYESLSLVDKRYDIVNVMLAYPYDK